MNFSKVMDFAARAFAKFGKIQVVDIGANPVGGPPPYQPLIDWDLCHVTGFEPQKEAHSRLVALNYPNANYINVAVGDGNAHSLYCYEGSGLSSLFPLRRDNISSLEYRGHELRSVEQVETVKLDKITQVASIDFLKVDTQGSELMIFRGGKKKLKNALAIQTEMRMLRLYDGEPSLGAVMSWLEKENFEFHNFISMNRFPMRGTHHRGFNRSQRQQIGDVDGLFFRNLTRLKALEGAEIGRQACIAAALGQTNYVMFCINELIARNLLTEQEREDFRRIVVAK
ncbi:MAG: FkbM family methyltransferase [Litoreibacter sp.]